MTTQSRMQQIDTLANYPMGTKPDSFRLIKKTFKSGEPMKTEGGNLAASKIRNLECPNYEICLIDYGCGKFNRKIHIMEQYP